MQPSNQPHEEWRKAALGRNGLIFAKTLEESEECWKMYLHRLERCWNKIHSHYGKSPKWSGWQGPFLKQRKQDPLLSYLIKARGRDEHSVEDIVNKRQHSLGLGPLDQSQPMVINNFKMDNGVVTYDGYNIAETFTPGGLELLTITYKGREYPPPVTHLGKPLKSNLMVDIADLGLEYYADVIKRAEKFFIT